MATSLSIHAGTEPGNSPVPGFLVLRVPDFSLAATRERLSPSAMDGFFAIADKWELTVDQQSALLGGVSKSTLFNYRKVAGVRTQDELTRISYVVGIYQALQVAFPEELAKGWMTRPNDHPLFGGLPPLDYVMKAGIPGLQQVRRLLEEV
jgi:uncharacterized protein (DUF2384 family)